ncbi:MAG: hypothetical protein Q8P38_04795 [Candidatus Nanopelagicales bacterium]|nr:hypothetical protein [Candidatus Nanopelagicales bacterium]
MVPSSPEERAQAVNVANLYKLVSQIPETIERVETLIQAPVEAGSIRDRVAKLDFAAEAFAIASIHVAAGLDALRSLHFLVLREPDDRNLRITVHGACVLVRQSLESGASARWLVGDLSLTVLQQRGFAAVWRSTHEQASYLNSLRGDPLTQKANETCEQLIADGQRLELVGARGRGDREKILPKVRVPDSASLARAVPLRPEIVDAAANVLGPGVANAEWLYRWSSGMAHGYMWAALSDSELVASRLTCLDDVPICSVEGMTRLRLDHVRFALALLTAIDVLTGVAAIVADSGRA